ncbi:DNA alkylation repair protein [uncultured Microbacterium sp.]|uniref:DNA alkylation repair enzyme n=1 Tax=uncultured Microbacterium sp. TaxID=191216 RepID=A0A1Y5PE10_9MICO|nr:DNA alkylation repair protein [uncultured Microbacterium sp.]SBS74138.1 conserved hypothetical protein [uncultured Microbacterium sp.]
MATVDEVRAELAALEDPRMREVNERHGDDHGVNLTKLRAVAKRLGTDEAFARELWATGETPLLLVALLIAKPRHFSVDELDAMLRDAHAPKVVDWLVSYIVKPGPHVEELRRRWIDDEDATVSGAGWALTAHTVTKKPELLDLEAVLDTIESDMKEAPGRRQWEMNTTLAMIGIHHPDLRSRALDIGERLEVLKDYPTPPNCTSPFAPAWIGEMVSRQER